ncbi:RNA polymerase sigma factor SigV [anaerobic digester metagenome]
MEQQSLHMDDCAENVIRYYSDMVYRLAFARTGTKQDADDIFQEVFLRYVKKKPIFKNEEHRKAWLIRVTINCSNNFWSSLWKKKSQELTNEETVETEETINLCTELQQLPLKYREVIHLFYYENMSLEEISLVLNRKNSTIRTQLTRARVMLKKFMKEEDYV